VGDGWAYLHILPERRYHLAALQLAALHRRVLRVRRVDDIVDLRVGVCTEEERTPIKIELGVADYLGRLLEKREVLLANPGAMVRVWAPEASTHERGGIFWDLARMIRPAALLVFQLLIAASAWTLRVALVPEPNPPPLSRSLLSSGPVGVGRG